MRRATRASAALLAGALCGAAAQAEPLPCREDERLTEAAATLVLSGRPPRADELLASARAHGFDGVALHARETPSESGLRSWLAGLAATGEGELTCGEATSETRRLVLAAVRGGRMWRSGQQLHAVLTPGFSSPQLVVETAAGELVSLTPSVAELASGLLLPRELAVRRVQLVAESESGPRPLAELAFDRPPGRAADQHADTSEPHVRTPEAQLAALSSLRRASSLGQLRDNRLLGESAQRHAARVCELGRLAHRLDGQDPELRLRREHVAARAVGEVLARGESSAAAWRALVDSPSHRLALLRRDFTDVGIGQAVSVKQQVCLVVLLAAWPRRIP